MAGAMQGAAEGERGMIGRVGMALRGAALKGRGGVLLTLLTLLLGAVLTPLMPPPLAPNANAGQVLTDAASPWVNARLPDPQAQSRLSKAPAIVSSQRWKAAPAGSPGPDPDSLAVDSPWRPHVDALWPLALPRVSTVVAVAVPSNPCTPQGPPFPAV